jgi:environmental stress-induced protein Ves
VLDPGLVEPVRWLNGFGSTRLLATGTLPDGDTAWRISVADLEQEAPFSSFPETDRLFVALGPLRLVVSGRPVDLVAGEQLRFHGEQPVTVQVLEPTRALNVMTRRAACRADVILRSPGDHITPGATHVVPLGDIVADVQLRAIS